MKNNKSIESQFQEYKEFIIKHKLAAGIILLWLILPSLWSVIATIKTWNVDDLKQTIEKQDNIITEKNFEIQRLEQSLTPFRTIALEKYVGPEQEVLQKLAADIENIRSLAIRDEYNTLVAKKQEELITTLQSVYEKHSDINPRIVVSVQEGSSVRQKVANDLIKYFKNAGWEASKMSRTFFDRSTDISIKMNPEDIGLAEQVANIVHSIFISEMFAAAKSEKCGRGEIIIELDGDPLFSNAGVVSFK